MVYEADIALADRMRSGQQNAFDEFFEHCAPRLTAFLARRCALDADGLEDVVQATLIKAVGNLNAYRGEAALLTWVTTIGRRELADAARRGARRPTLVSLSEPRVQIAADSSAQRAGPPEPPEIAAADAHRVTVMAVLDALPESYAQVLESKYGDDLSVEEIAQQRGTSCTAIQSLLARARAAFREQWLATAGTRNGGDANK